MIMKALFIAVAAVSAIAAPAFAQDGSGAYGAIGFAHHDGDNAKTSTITGRLGYDFNRYIGVEGEASAGIRKDDITVAGVSGDVRQKWDVAGYVVAKYPVTDHFELFARGGYGNTKLERKLAGRHNEVGGDSWNYGLGANYYFDESNGVRADWTRRDYQGDAGAANVWAASYVRRF